MLTADSDVMALFEHTDYRAYLREFMASLPKKGHGAVNRMAEHLRVHPSFISQVLTGKRDLNVEQAQDLASFLGLVEIETDYLLLLVQTERAGTVKLKSYFRTKLEKTRTEAQKISHRIRHDRVLSETERAEFYSNWLYSAVRLFTSIEEGKTLEEICVRFAISRAKARTVLEFLTATRLCVEHGGKYRMGTQRTHLPGDSPLVQKHHTNWRLKAIQNSDETSEEELMFTAPLSISRKDFARLREQIMAMIKAASEQVAKTEAEEVACFNVDLFWVKK
jgi:uncharacterized protein (TIGR02147 family)